MAMLVLDRTFENQVRSEREARGLDTYDEVWDGVYVMSPIADDLHQLLMGRLFALLDAVIGLTGRGEVRPGVNVSDRDTGWVSNYRVPDVAVFLAGTSAVNHDTYWQGGPDFAIEIISDDDRSREKLGFYAQVGVRELLLVDRKPWALELYRLQSGRLELVGRSTPEKPSRLISEVVGLSFQMEPGTPRPRIEVVEKQGGQVWRI